MPFFGDIVFSNSETLKSYKLHQKVCSLDATGGCIDLFVVPGQELSLAWAVAASSDPADHTLDVKTFEFSFEVCGQQINYSIVTLTPKSAFVGHSGITLVRPLFAHEKAVAIKAALTQFAHVKRKFDALDVAQGNDDEAEVDDSAVPPAAASSSKRARGKNK